MRYIGQGAIPRVLDVADFKRSQHIRPSDVSDDENFGVLLDAAQDAVVRATNLPPASGAYECEFVLAGARRWWFPCRPVAAITAVAVNDEAGAWIDQPLDGVRLVRAQDEPQILIAEGWSGFTADGADSLRVQFTAGAALPPAALQAIGRLAKEWHDADIAIEGEAPASRMTMGARALIRSVRYMRPRYSRGW